MHRDVVRILY